MTVFVRILHDRADPTIAIAVRVFTPALENGNWWCRFAIGWPEGERTLAAGGQDAIQAFDLALKMIGANLYTSARHEDGRLIWLQEGRGYGFPVPQNIRDLLIGDDSMFF